MHQPEDTIRVAIFGYGRHAEGVRVPPLLAMPDVRIVAVADLNDDRLARAAELPGPPRTYSDAMQMVEEQDIDILFSLTGPLARGPVECAAAARGAHIYTEKPQAHDIRIAVQMDEAVRSAGVMGEVGYRERYRPLFQEARSFLADKSIVHARYHWAESRRPGRRRRTGRRPGSAIEWGCHATDYLRFMTGLEIARAQAFHYWSEAAASPLSVSVNYQFENGATATLGFPRCLHEPYDYAERENPDGLPWFMLYYEGGYLALHGYRKLVANGEVIYEAEPFDPWREQIISFVEAVRRRDPSRHLADFHDCFRSIAAILAAWESGERDGECIEVGAFVRGAQMRTAESAGD